MTAQAEERAERARSGRSIAQKVCVWFIFGGVFGVLPLIVRGLELGIRGGPFSWQALLGDGELFISSSAIAAGGMGDLLFSAPLHLSDRRKFFRTIVGGLSLALCACDSVAYLIAKSPPPAGNVVGYSLTLFGCTLLAAGTCVGLAVER